MQEKTPLSEKWILLVFICWALFLSFEFWGFGPASYVKIPDSADANLADRLALRQNIKDHENGLWNVDLLAGVDRISQATTLGVFDYLFLIFPGWLAYGSFLFVQRFVAGYFTFKVLNKHLSISFLLALFPALFFSLYSQNQINHQFDGFTIYDGLGLPSIPLVLYVLGNLAAKGKLIARREIFFAFALGMLFANVSSFIFTIFFFPLIFLWLLFMFPRNGKTALLIGVTFVLGWLSIEIFELIATYLYTQLSQRNLRESCTGVARTTFFSISRFLPYYVLKADNIPALILGIFGLVFWRDRVVHRRGIAALLFLVVFILASFYLPRMVCSPSNPIEFVKGFNYSRFYFYFPFLISIFAAFGLQNLIDYLQYKLVGGENFKARFASMLSALLIGFTIYLGINVKKITLQARLAGSNYANIFMNPYLDFLAGKIRNSAEHYRAVTILASPGFLWPYGINTLDGYTGIYPLRFSNYWRVVIDPMMLIYPRCTYGEKLANGNARVILSAGCDIGETIGVSHVSDLFDLDLLSLGGARYFVSTTKLANPQLAEIDTSEVSCLNSIPGCAQYYLYENENAFPFVFDLSQIAVRSNDEKILDILKEVDTGTLRKNAYVSSDDVFGLDFSILGSANSTASLLDYTSDHLLIHHLSSEGKIMVINWNYSPDWKVWIDGQPDRPFSVDNTLIGFLVPKGDHTIELRYLPKYSSAFFFYKLFGD